MTQHASPLFLNTILTGGTPQQKLRAAKSAGFDQVELWQQDVQAADGGVFTLAPLLHELQLGLTDYQVLLDFDGARGDKREDKRREALTMMDNAVKLRANTILTPASTDPCCDAGCVLQDLRWLTAQAAERGLRVAYEAMAWSQHINTTDAAWQLIQKTGAGNIGLVVDAFHIFAGGRTLDDLTGIPAEKIYLVQLSDLSTRPQKNQLVETARHHRLLPGEGNFPLTSLLQHLKTLDYRGPVGLEVFNDERQAADAHLTADAAMQSLRRVLDSAGYR
ncbi:sugar phosphate isomerase/epimerase [Erwinia sp. Leaf53]|uniref:sugar phosphate isomerase/epimerase family protein n=1 Tax=Erwinia sp. Leaf53 TaxID=1736225 RepID=UPI0006F56281|nr:sugar phosphate isomerase/epimerase family protein [Erwinia sp. Leaf53]KQN53076.1 4-hydroxyphenylpyruvate dioxygenase [Erwinia sp. Leaf53]